MYYQSDVLLSILQRRRMYIFFSKQFGVAGKQFFILTIKFVYSNIDSQVSNYDLCISNLVFRIKFNLGFCTQRLKLYQIQIKQKLI